MIDELICMSLTDVAGAIRKKKISSVEVTKCCLAWVERIQPKLNCFISVEHEEVLKAARQADKALARGDKLGPLHGVPLAHKDMFYRQGKISTCGSKILRDYRPNITATVIRRLNAAGALWLGGLNMSEFAANPTGQNEHWGRCRNPWNLDFISGGSSSGSAAAVAVRACYGSLGSDTGGSIRMPAAICGVVGLKPTNGRVSRFGAMPRAWSHDCIGPITRTVCDCARITRVIAGADPNDPTSSNEPVPDYEKNLRIGIKGVRIGVPANYFSEGVTADVQACIDASLTVMKSLGTRIVRIPLPDLEQAFTLSTLMTECEASTFHANWMRTRPQDYSEAVRRRLEPGFHIPATSYIEAQNVREQLRQEFLETVFDRVDVIHTPVMTIPVPTAAEAEDKLSGNMRALMGAFTRNTRPISYLGLPGLTVPAGFSANGMPVGFQLFGRPFSEELLLRVGHAYQSVTDWHRRAPVLWGDSKSVSI